MFVNYAGQCACINCTCANLACQVPRETSMSAMYPSSCWSDAITCVKFVLCRRRRRRHLSESDTDEDGAVTFLQREMRHKWIVDEDTGDTQWFTGIALSSLTHQSGYCHWGVMYADWHCSGLAPAHYQSGIHLGQVAPWLPTQVTPEPLVQVSVPIIQFGRLA